MYEPVGILADQDYLPKTKHTCRFCRTKYRISIKAHDELDPTYCFHEPCIRCIRAGAR